MAYGSIKADNLIHDNGGSDVTVSISSLAAKASTTGATFTGNIDLDNQKELRLRQADASANDTFIALRAPATVTSDVTLTFPNGLPAVVAADQAAPNTGGTGVLQSDNNGGMTWAALGLDVAATWTRPQRAEITSVSHGGATINIDFNASNNFLIQLVSGVADVTSITATNVQPGQSGSIFIQQPASGSTVALSGWNPVYRFPAQTALAAITATLGVVDRIDYVIKDANEIHCVSTLNMSQS